MLTRDETALLNYLRDHGVATSAQIQQATQKSQATVSRLLGSLPTQVITLGRGRGTRYGTPQNIGDTSAQQTLWLTEEGGAPQRIGTLSLLAKNQLHVDADKVDELYASELPWYLSPLRVQGFLGRLQAQRLALQGLTPNPESWDLHAVLIAALRLHDAPGAIVIGHDNAHLQSGQGGQAVGPTLPSTKLGPALDALARDVAHTLPAGSSAGGEQPKFLARTHDGRHVLVKFSPPRGTPFGERWSDLLHAEHLCGEVLTRHGQAAAPCQVVQSEERTYLISERFDRIGPIGRKHVVALGAVHAAFVPGSYSSWGASCEALARQGRLPERDADAASFRLQFGRLIGNTDMHSGNLGLFAQGASLSDLVKGRFTLAPSYDMLPMRWKPDPMTGALDYGLFSTEDIPASSAARSAAQEFWAALAQHEGVSELLRAAAFKQLDLVGSHSQAGA